MTYSIRPATYDDAAALADCVIEPMVTTFRGRVPDQCLEWITREESTANWQAGLRDPSHTNVLHVAEMASGQVVGCAMAGPQRVDAGFAGELYLLGVLSPYQGRGIGRALVASVARQLAQTGMASICVCVLSLNPHRAFYERLGGQFVREQPYDWNGVALPEAIYGWPDITRLCKE